MTGQASGSCLCNAIQYRVNDLIRMVANGHCNRCKKITGAAFQTVELIDENSLTITEGPEFLTAYAISEIANKHFCRRCGTPIFNRHTKVPGRLLVSVGSLDDRDNAIPTINVFCENMLPWVGNIVSLIPFPQGFNS